MTKCDEGIVRPLLPENSKKRVVNDREVLKDYKDPEGVLGSREKGVASHGTREAISIALPVLRLCCRRF